MMNIMKKIIILTIMCLSVFSVSAFAENAMDMSFRVFYDGQEISFPDEKPFANTETQMPDGTIYSADDNRIKFVPIRPISDALGYNVSWDGETKTVTLEKDEKVVTFVLGGQCLVNGVSKSCVVNFPLKNGRVFVSQFALCHVFDCTLYWDEPNRILYLYSREKYPAEVDLTQDRYLNEDIKFKESVNSDVLNEFFSMAEPTFVIPGLQQAVIPQGIAYRKDTNQFYITGYLFVGHSRMAVVDAATGELTAQYRLLNADGSPHVGHMSGVAISDDNLYLAQGGNTIQRISLAAIDAADSNGFLQIEEEIKLATGFESGNSFVEISDGYLWLGNYYQPGHKRYSKRATENYNVLMRGYKLDSSQPNDLDARYKVENSKCDYIPEIIYALESDERIQGMTSTENYLVTAVSTSKGLSLLRVYDTTKAVETDGLITIGESAQLPVYKLKLKKTVSAPSMIEEVSAVNGFLYTVYESGSQYCGDATREALTDKVWKVNIEKLVAPVAE